VTFKVQIYFTYCKCIKCSFLLCSFCCCCCWCTVCLQWEMLWCR